MKKVQTIAALTALLFSPASYPVFIDGHELVAGMKAHVAADIGASNFDPIKATSFRAYVSGYADARNGISICPTKKQNYYVVYWAVVTKFLQENPARWSQHPSTLVSQALNKAFPCK